MILSFKLWALFFFSMMTRPACHGDQGIRTDTLIQGQQLMDGQSLYSSNSAFRLEFLTPSGSKGRFLVISDNYNPDSYYTRGVVWVANRDNPVPDTSGNLIIDPQDGLLKILFKGGNITITLSNITLTQLGGNASATLLDDGNFVLNQLNSDGSVNSTLWQSFDYPTDTLLPGMKLGTNLRTGHQWTLTSWLSGMVPASGIFTFSLSVDPNGMVELIMWSRGTFYWTTGFLHDGWFDQWSFLSCYNFSYISNKDERYITFSVNCSEVDRTGLTLTSGGDIIAATISKVDCYRRLPEGCDWSELPDCRKRQGEFSFERTDGYFDGESYAYPENSNLTFFECQSECVANCSCVAFGSTADDGTGCEVWGKLSSSALNGPDGKKRILYIFVPGSARKNRWLWIVPTVAGAVILSLGILFYLIKRRKLNIKGKIIEIKEILRQVADGTASSPTNFTSIGDKTIRFFSLDSIKRATDNFSDANKLGEGGFGPVYKGTLSCGLEVAIKRLSRSSAQGLVEFENEVLLIGKLQHTNLVKLLGSCIEGQETILVYEYMSNKSLDHFLFDSSRQGLLRWTVRMKIIEGIAQGLLYLHKYSRLKIIHRDLKAGNILLDDDMNPKISDFGMARIFEVQESVANTKRIVGTYGYMSPEYIINGTVSLKTDVFSFGVLLLEIISGKKNRNSYDDIRPLNLVGLAWQLWVEGRATELIDSSMDDHLEYKSEVMKCINISLLCVQDSPMERPSMMDVVSMLTNEFVQLPTPKQPAFFIETSDRATSSNSHQSINELSISLIGAR